VIAPGRSASERTHDLVLATAPPAASAPIQLSGLRRVAARMITWTLRALHATLRDRWVGADRLAVLHADAEPLAVALWHGRSILLAPSRSGEPIVFAGRCRVVLVSRSADGAWAAAVLTDLGFEVVRGSSSAGAVGGLRALRRALTVGSVPVLTVDGPRGPAGSVAPGIVAVAPPSGLWLIPVASAARSGWRLRSWDRLWIPRPFTTVIHLVGQPVHVAGDAAAREVARSSLEARLRSLHRTADRLCGRDRRRGEAP
jgi:lysophospholipid acyltransferase (LPLAT)-like uncharacterized protein